jgi:hypothetical protein
MKNSGIEVFHFHLDFTNPFQLYNDVSVPKLGAVVKDKGTQPISLKLNTTQKLYSIAEKSGVVMFY